MSANPIGRIVVTAYYCFAFPFRYLRNARRALYWVFFLHLLVTFAWAFADPFIQRFMIDQLASRKLLTFTAAVLTAFAMYLAMHWLSWRTTVLRADVDRVLSALLMDKAMSALYSHAPKRGAQGSSLLSRVMSEPSQLAGTTTFSLEIFGIGLTFLFSVLFCAFVSLYALLPLIILLPVVLLVVMRDARSAHGASVRVERRRAEATSHISQSLEAMALFVPFRILGRVRREVTRSFSRYRWESRQLIAGRARVNRNARMAMSGVEVLMFAAVAFVVIQKNLSIGSYFGLVAAYWRLLSSVKDIAEKLPMIAVNYGRIRRFERFCARKPGLWFTTSVANQCERLIVNGLSIRKHDGSSNRVHLDLSPGDRLVLTGANGAGKTSLLTAISCPGRDQDGFVEAPAPVSLVSSPPVFPRLTAARLLRLDTADSTEMRSIHDLALQLGLDPDRFEECPQAWSDGEKRRLGILLSLSKKASLYLMDEPLSGLESMAKYQIMQAIIERTRDAVLVVALHETELISLFSHHLDLTNAHEDARLFPKLTSDRKSAHTARLPASDLCTLPST